MKKLYAILLLLVSLVPAQAQVTLGTDLWASFQNTSFSKQGTDALSPDAPKATSFEVSPRLGFNLGAKMQLGLAFGYAHTQQLSLDGYYDPIASSWHVTDSLHSSLNTISAGIYLRILVGESGHFRVYFEPSVTYGVGFGVDGAIREQYSTITGMPEPWSDFCRNVGENVLSLGVVPVVQYQFDSHFSLDLTLNFAALRYQHRQTTRSGLYIRSEVVASPQEDESFTTDTFDIGLHMRSTSLISIGLNYTF